MNFESSIFQPCKEWLAEKIDESYSWADILCLCVDPCDVEKELSDLIDSEGWPENLTINDWALFVAHYREFFLPVSFVPDEVVAIDNGEKQSAYMVPAGFSSTWEQYAKSLSGKMSPVSIAEIRNGCIWILRHLKEDTREYGPVKGLVTGSVQSGKTASMEGLVSMAADYGWNFFIVLSGTIDSLRKQTQDRFMEDLKVSEGVSWRVIDFAGEDKKYSAEELHLNALSGNKNFVNRYVTVCLKNKSRLKKLIDWLYEDPNRTSKLRILILDDEADQASINTASITDEEEQERCAINELIVNLANGKKSDGSTPATCIQALNYISYTATPYANVLNESSAESLYPKDFICTLPEAREYFGVKVIFGNDEEKYPGFDIVRQIPLDQETEIKDLHKGRRIDLPESMKKSIAWFLCASAVLRTAGHKKSISMLIHTTQIQNDHKALYDAIAKWLSNKNEVLSFCKDVYEEEIGRVTRDSLIEANPDYPNVYDVKEYGYSFTEINAEINSLIYDVCNIMMDEEGSFDYSEGLHLCRDNSRAKREAEEGTYLRIVYPSEEQLSTMNKAPVFLVIGGNTLSRGLTVDGLICTYFARNVNQADTLMQMARWFGYRKGYELLQRIWMTQSVRQKFYALAKIDMDLKQEVALFMERGLSPANFGPRIRNTPEIAKFLVTSKKKSQKAEYGDFDFCGDSYETTAFDDNQSLSDNLNVAKAFFEKLETSYSSRYSTAAKAFVWDAVDYDFICSEILDSYVVSPNSSLSTNMPIFRQWMIKMKDEGRYSKWNVAVVDGKNKDRLWDGVPGKQIGFVERNPKANQTGYLDIGSLRSGSDAICDVNESTFTPEQVVLFQKTRKNGKDIIARRCDFNLEDTPLLLVYLIQKNGGTPRSKSRVAMNASDDLVGISIIVSGDSIGASHARTLRVKINEE